MTILEPALDTGPSPYHDLIGFRLVEWREDFARAQLAVAEHHLNRSGVVHGGVFLSLLDQIAGFAGLYAPAPGGPRFAVTLSISCSFMGQARAGVLTAIGRKVGGGRNIYMTRSEVRDEAGAALALAQGVHRYRAGSEPAGGAPAGG
ncbi:MAG: PaaI family thioesterase [Proteobacteria bacterium]|nr:PaaI family thioesterase [Pseudomonadota bacterium]